MSAFGHIEPVVGGVGRNQCVCLFVCSPPAEAFALRVCVNVHKKNTATRGWISSSLRNT